MKFPLNPMLCFLKSPEIPRNSPFAQMGYTDRREVKQFQFTAWPDHGEPFFDNVNINGLTLTMPPSSGVPEHSAPFLQFIRRIHMMNPTDSGPIVTHCRSENVIAAFC